MRSVRRTLGVERKVFKNAVQLELLHKLRAMTSTKEVVQSGQKIKAQSIIKGKQKEEKGQSEIYLQDDDSEWEESKKVEIQNEPRVKDLVIENRTNETLPNVEVLKKKKRPSLEIMSSARTQGKNVMTPKFETPTESSQLNMEAFQNEVKHEMESEAHTPIHNVLEEDSVDSKIDESILDNQREGRRSSSQIYPDDSISAQYYCGSSSQLTPSASRGDFTSQEHLTMTGHEEKTEEVVMRKIRDIEELAREEIDLELLGNPQIEKISKKGKTKLEFNEESYAIKRQHYLYTPISEEEEGLVSQKLTSIMKSNHQSQVTEHESNAEEPTQLKLPLAGVDVIEKSRPYLDESEIEDLKNAEDVYYLSSKISTQRLASENQSSGLLDFYGHPGDHIGFRYEVIAEVEDTPTYALFLCKDHKDLQTEEEKEMKLNEVLVKVYKLKHSKQADTENRLISLFEDWTVCALDVFQYRACSCSVFESKILRYSLALQYDSPDLDLKKVLTQLLLFLKSAHAQNFVLCALGTHNILINRDQHLLFFSIEGLTHVQFLEYQFLKNTSNMSPRALKYISPQILLGLPVNWKTDIWSVGCILLEIITQGNLRFTIKATPLQRTQELISFIGMPSSLSYLQSSPQLNGQTIAESTTRNEAFLSLDETLSIFTEKEDIADLIRKCLKWEPEERITLQEALRHPFLKGES